MPMKGADIMAEARQPSTDVDGGPLSVLAAGLALLNSDELVRAIETEAVDLLSAASPGYRSIETSGESPPPSGPADRQTRPSGVTSQLDDLGGTLPAGDQRAISLQLLTKAEGLATQIRDERLRQAKLAFNVAIAMASIGVLLIFAGAALVIAGVTSAAIVSTVVAGISEWNFGISAASLMTCLSGHYGSEECWKMLAN